MSLSSKQIETLLFGTERQRRFTQDSPVLPDVWLAYNQNPCAPVDLLLTPYRNGQPAELYTQLRTRLKGGEGRKGSPWRITYNESYVVAELTFRELIRAALPLTKWWVRYVWPEARRKRDKEVSPSEPPLGDMERNAGKGKSPLATLGGRVMTNSGAKRAPPSAAPGRRSATRTTAASEVV